jgi:tRNA-specific 2-thiouridylase
MSGGVDSSTSAALMKERGFEVIGCTLRMFDAEKVELSIENAKRVADFLKINHEIIDCRQKFGNCVLSTFVKSYICGLTPNPCVLCNKFVKFEYLNLFRLKYDASLIVTGHYAQIFRDDESIILKQAEDSNKDQSYFLYGVDREILKFTFFPLGAHTKTHTRELARKFGLHVADSSESQDICFLINENYASYIKKHAPSSCIPGNIIDFSGNTIGRHSGIINYTVGQRKGLGLSGGPFFVSDINAEKNDIVVSKKRRLAVTKIFLEDTCFLNEEYLGECLVKVRSSGPKISAKIIKESNGYCAELRQQEHGVAKGQHCVFYQENVVLGGGRINSVN